VLIRLILVLAGSYALGCLVAAYYLTRLRHGADIRASGSGNAGARNVARLYGPFDAILTLILDAAKGSIAVLAGIYFVGPEWAAVLALAAAIAGHIWPAQLSFHGGKGVATGLGGFLTLDPLATLAVLGVGVLGFGITRDFYRSGLFGIALAAPMLWLFGHSFTTVALVAATSLLCLVVHHPYLDAPRQPQKRTGTAG
jgi:glycerol-3-phosphate acyltransferase PlsY